MPNPASTGQPNPASYRDNGDGTVTDNVTCLTWQKASPTTTYTVDGGRAYCATLGTGWRLATRVEMASINDFTRSGSKFPSPFMGAAAFYKTGSEWVLTTKQIGAGAGTDYGWAYNMSDGIVSNARSGGTADRVHCVRGSGDDAYDTRRARSRSRRRTSTRSSRRARCGTTTRASSGNRITRPPRWRGPRPPATARG